MQKKSWTFVCYAFVTGAFAMFLRWLQLINCFEEDTGLFISGSALTPAFIIMLFIACAGILVMSLLFRLTSDEPAQAFRVKSPLCMVFTALLSLVMLVGAILLFIQSGSMCAELLFRLLAVLAIAAAAAMFVVINRMSSGRADNVSCFCFVVIVLFYCLWLVASYKSHDSDPVIWDYWPEILALASGTLSWYYLAGFAFGRPRPRATVFFCGLSFILELVCMPDDRSASLSLLLIAPALESLMLSWILIRNLQRENRH